MSWAAFLCFCFANVAARRKAANQSNAETRDRTGDLQIFGLTLSQLSYRGNCDLIIFKTLCIVSISRHM